MSGPRRRTLVFVVMLSLCAAWAIGCGGSSAHTSRADVAAVARAERELDSSWGRANAGSMKSCERNRDAAAAEKCIRRVVPVRVARALGRFTEAIEKVIASGVGGECKAALEEAIQENAEVPYYPGATAATCRAESRKG